MRRDFNAKLGMFNSVIHFLDKSTDITAAVPKIEPVFADFKAKVNAIRTTFQMAASAISGTTKEKELLKEKVCREANRIAAALSVYAEDSLDAELQKEMEYSFNELETQKDNELPAIALNIWSKAGIHLSNLADYKITADILTAFNTLINQYTTSIADCKTARALRKTTNSQLEVLFKAANAILKDKLDKLILQLEENTRFYREYRNNRAIDGPIRKYTQVAGTITDAKGSPIARVRVADSTNRYTATSDVHGKYALKIPEFRKKHHILFTLEGYLPVQEANVRLMLGKITYKNIQMMPEE